MEEPLNVADPIGILLRQAQDLLRSRSDCANLEAQLLLAHVLRQPRSYLAAHPERTPTPAETARYRELLRRRITGEPVAYLTGEREFWSLSLRVTPDVLIPRPETELTVERCLALRANEVSQVADLGTGSGAIALALASERPIWSVVATDRSEAALRVAQANARRLACDRVVFRHGDWFEPLHGSHFHLVVSNPPYIAAGDPHLTDLRFEPACALTPGSSGMEALQTIVLQARDHLLPGGWLVLEHGAEQRESVARALVAAGFSRVRCYADLAGHDRVTEAQWP